MFSLVLIQLDQYPFHCLEATYVVLKGRYLDEDCVLTCSVFISYYSLQFHIFQLLDELMIRMVSWI